MLDVIVDTLLDAAKLLPFLFLTYLAMEYLEHKFGDTMNRAISGKKIKGFMPVIGSLCGCVPQCGFSAAASNLYAGRVITLGTLISIYLSTSDEMLPIMISEHASAKLIFSIIGIKVVYGMIAGILIDLFIRTDKSSPRIHEMCEHEHCHCEKEHGILMPAIKHTLRIILFLIAFSFVLNCIIYFIGEDNIKNIILDKPFLGEIISGAVGLIPNCASSVIITELYLSGLLSFGSMMSGLFVGAGVGLVVLFRANKSIKESIKVMGILYAAGVFGGLILDLIGISF